MKLFNSFLYLNSINIATNIYCMENNSGLNKIKSKFFVNNLLQEHLLQSRKLKIVNYNKEFQKRLDINIKDYINYQNAFNIIAKYDNIEDVEEVKKNVNDGNINLLNKKNSFVIYNEGFRKVVNVISLCNNDDLYKMFRIFQKTNILTVKSKYPITSLVDMFGYFNNLQEVDLSKLNVEKVKSMSWLFIGCNKLKKVNLSNVNAKNLIDTTWMFANCFDLIDVNFDNFITKKLKTTNCMFQDCHSIKKLNLLSFNTSKVVDMGGMFYNCVNLEDLDLSKFDFIRVEDFTDMFLNCKKLKNINVKKIIIRKDAYTFNMFRNSGLEDKNLI